MAFAVVEFERKVCGCGQYMPSCCMLVYARITYACPGTMAAITATSKEVGHASGGSTSVVST